MGIQGKVGNISVMTVALSRIDNVEYNKGFKQTTRNSGIQFYSPLKKDIKGCSGFRTNSWNIFINKQFGGIKRDKFERGQIEMTINGDPLFAESGIVTFR